MASADDSFIMERKVIQEFIEVYRSEPALWKVKSSHYNNKTIKNAAYRRLLYKLRELYPEADIDMVKKKINALRTNFRKEQRKVEASRERGKQTGEPIYVPSLWYYELFHFIADQENDLKSNEVDGSIDVQDMLRVEMDENVYYDAEDSDENFDEEFQASSPDSPKVTDADANAQSMSMDDHRSLEVAGHPSFKRRRLDLNFNPETNWFLRQEQQQQSASYGPVANGGNEIFGRYVSSKLKTMDKPMQMLSERLISEILYRGQMGCLGRNTMLCDGHPKVTTKVESPGNSYESL